MQVRIVAAALARLVSSACQARAKRVQSTDSFISRGDKGDAHATELRYREASEAESFSSVTEQRAKRWPI